VQKEGGEMGFGALNWRRKGKRKRKPRDI